MKQIANRAIDGQAGWGDFKVVSTVVSQGMIERAAGGWTPGCQLMRDCRSSNDAMTPCGTVLAVICELVTSCILMVAGKANTRDQNEA